MKTFITTILKTFAVAALLTTGATFADAASFDTQPGSFEGFYDGFASINTDCSSDCANDYDSVSFNDIMNNGNGEFTVYLNFRNDSSGTINNARASVNFPSSGTSSSAAINATLSGAGSINDDARITGLPDSWEIDYVDGFVRVEEHYSQQNNTPCSEAFPGNWPWQVNNINNLSNITIGALHDWGDGYCDQGYVFLTFAITDTSTPIVDVTVGTLNENNVDENSATLNGEVLEGENIQDVWFALTTGSNPVCTNTSHQENVPGNYSLDAGDLFELDVNGLQSGTTYRYRACAWDGFGEVSASNIEIFTTLNGNTGGNNVNVVTESESNVDENSATLNGRLTDGQNVNVSFAYSTQSFVTCNTGQLVNSDNSLDATSNFSETVDNLLPDTTYYYVACGFNNDGNDQGSTESFTTSSNGGNNGDAPIAITEDEDNVDENSAELNGDIDMNGFTDGDVFFVWGQDESDIEDVEDENRYSDVDEDGDNIQKEEVDDNFDGDDDFELDVYGLDTDETYYFRICVEYEDDDNDDQLECGDVERFDTDDDDSNNNNDVEIRTDAPRNITQTVAEMCGTLEEDGGSSQQTWIEFRRADQNSYSSTPIRQRNEISFCERVSGLTSNTTYLYRACTPEGCAPTRTFRTQGANIQNGIAPVIITGNPTNIRSNSATLNGTYVANANSATCWFEYGRTAGLGKQTRTYNVNGVGSCTHNFTNLASNTQYCVRAVIQTQFGTDRGSTRCFNTLPSVTTGGPGPVSQPPIIVVDPEEDEDLDLGLGLSLVRLEIDNEEEIVTQGDNVTYVIEWENISELDLEDLGLKVVMPEEVQITNISRGRLDKDTNSIYFTIDELDGADFEENEPGDKGQMTVSGVIGRGTLGNLLTAEAELAYDNPINDAQENARDFDLDEYGARVGGVTASVFGLTNITFLGWLVILLGLFIIFLVARWLYLEREELRAQAYMSGGYQPNYGGPAAYNNGYGAPQNPNYGGQPVGYNNAPVAPQQPAPEPHYTPYKPNRG